MKRLIEGIASHVEAWREAWAVRHVATPAKRSADEIAFLPAHLELVESPVSPSARTTQRLIVAIFVVALAWACLGHLDIVASAPGRTVATSRTKTLQPMETAIVRRIAARDGDAVRAGQILIELDDTQAEADRRKASDALAAAERESRRYTLLAAAIDTEILPEAASVSEDETRAHALAALDLAQYIAKKQALESTLDQRRREAATAEAQLPDLRASADIARRRADDTGALVASGHVARHEHLMREQERMDADRALTGQRTRVTELRAAIDAAAHELETHTALTRQQAADQQRQADENAAQYRQDLASAVQRKKQLTLVAPVDGTAQQLAVHTVGGVVTPGQALLAVVPDDDPLEVEAMIVNQDIGFVRAGQRVTVKIESFPYTRYGYLEGTVQSVSNDAAQDEKLGLVFPARVRLERTSLNIDGVEVALTPGMNVTAEIRTGRRRLIDYLLSPLREHVSEAGRER
ncbi:HlyD family type I secretion periplasmic adaptor subunit [Luteibacter jiangsuensis]